jgi:hypothetical protein
MDLSGCEMGLCRYEEEDRHNQVVDGGRDGEERRSKEVGGILRV